MEGESLAFHWLSARTLSGINTPHISSPVILHPPAYEDGTDRGFRNIGYYNSDAGELPKRQHITIFVVFDRYIIHSYMC